jgi:hypothetical protein
MWWHFRDQRIVTTDLKIVALHIADHSPRFFLPLFSCRCFPAVARHEFYLIGRPSALNAGSITVPSSVRDSP